MTSLEDFPVSKDPPTCAFGSRLPWEQMREGKATDASGPDGGCKTRWEQPQPSAGPRPRLHSPTL